MANKNYQLERSFNATLKDGTQVFLTKENFRKQVKNVKPETLAQAVKSGSVIETEAPQRLMGIAPEDVEDEGDAPSDAVSLGTGGKVARGKRD